MSIPKEPCDPTRLIRQRVYTQAARDGFELLLRQLAPQGDGEILLPAYLGLSPSEGSGVFDPVEATETPYSFYPVDEHLCVELDAVRRLLAERKASALFVIHYFGFPQPELLALRALCDEHGTLLIEDCAHCLEPRQGDTLVGEVGDYSLFSIHKVLPTAGGGYLQANAGRDLPGVVPVEAVIAGRDLEILCGADLEGIANQRRERYQQLHARLADVEGVEPLHAVLPEDVVPLNFPLRVHGVDRFELYKRLRARGVGAVALYHTLVPAITSAQYPISHALSRHILNLPIHQEVDALQVPLMVARLVEALRA